MVVQHNLTALNANRQLGISSKVQAKSTEKLSSGYKINRAADDAAGLSISEKMRAQIRGLTQASANAQDGISMAQTAEGALGEVTDMLQRMNELAVKAANGTMQSEDKSAIQSEINALIKEIDRVKDSTSFNDKKLLDGTLDVSLQVGADASDYNKISLSIDNMSASKLFVNSSGSTLLAKLTDKDGAEVGDPTLDIVSASALSAIKSAIETVSSQRSEIGAIQNRLEHTINNLDNVVENTTSAESAIRDTDMAEEMVKYSNQNILMQAGQAMLAQANQNNQGVLNLLQ